MLHLLETLLKTKSLYHLEQIGKIKHSCCPSLAHSVIDFDKIKDEFCATLKVKQLKSVDAIYLSTKKNVLYLIEMKEYFPPGIIPGKNLSCEDFIKYHFGKYAIGNKILDSLFILQGIMGFYGISKNFYSYFFDDQKLKIQTLFLTNFNYVDLVTLSLATLDQQNLGLTKRIEGETTILNCDGFDTLMKSA